MSGDGFGTGLPNRKGAQARAMQGTLKRYHAPDIWADNIKMGRIVAWSGIEGGSPASNMRKVEASQGGVWLSVQLDIGGKPIPIWCEDSIGKLMSEAGGNLMGRSVKCYFRGETVEDISNGYAKLVGSTDEFYQHPESSNPISVGSLNGASIDREAYGVFAGTGAAGESG